MKRMVMARFFAVVCLVSCCYLVVNLIGHWESYSMLRKSMRVLACLGWAGITYEAFTLRIGWLRRFVHTEEQ